MKTSSPRSIFAFNSSTVTSGTPDDAGCARRWRSTPQNCVVVDELVDRRMVAADRALGIAAQLQLAEAHLQRVVQEQPADERLAGSENQLDRFGGLDDADDARQDAQHAALGAARHQSRRRRLRVQAAIARAALDREHGRLPVEPEDAAVRVRLAEQHAGVVHQVPRLKVVGAVEDDVVVAAERRARSSRSARLRAVTTFTDGFIALRRSRAASSFGTADVWRAVDDLPLQVARSRPRRSRRGRACRRRRPPDTSRPARRARRRRCTARAPP